MTDERRVEVAADALMVHEHCDKRQALDPETQWQTRFSPEDREEYRDLARAVVAALDAHDGDLRAELNNLRRWKREALEVAAAWEQVWVELGQPGPLGASKAQASRVAVDALRRQYEADLDRVTYLRASAAVAERDEARAALARVEALHQPHTTTGGLTYCTAFRCCDPSGIPSEWPCDTRRAITGEEPSS